MSGHTPGPWVWTEPQKVLSAAHGRVIDHATYEGMWFAAYDAKTDEANARLIAAAPELLAALVAINDYSRDVPAVVQEMVRAAIAKATGESA